MGTFSGPLPLSTGDSSMWNRRWAPLGFPAGSPALSMAAGLAPPPTRLPPPPPRPRPRGRRLLSSPLALGPALGTARVRGEGRRPSGSGRPVPVRRRSPPTFRKPRFPCPSRRRGDGGAPRRAAPASGGAAGGGRGARWPLGASPGRRGTQCPSGLGPCHRAVNWQRFTCTRGRAGRVPGGARTRGAGGARAGTQSAAPRTVAAPPPLGGVGLAAGGSTHP